LKNDIIGKLPAKKLFFMQALYFSFLCFYYVAQSTKRFETDMRDCLLTNNV